MNLFATVKKKMIALMIISSMLLSIATFGVIKSSDDAKDSLPRVIELGELSATQEKVVALLRGYQLTFQDSMLNEYEDSFKTFISTASSLKAMLLSEVNRKDLDEVISLTNEWYEINKPRVEIIKKYKQGIFSEEFMQTQDGKTLSKQTTSSVEKAKIIADKVKIVQDRVIERNIERNANTALWNGNLNSDIFISISMLLLLSVTFLSFLQTQQEIIHLNSYEI